MVTAISLWVMFAASPSLYELDTGNPPPESCSTTPASCAELDKATAAPGSPVNPLHFRYVPLCTDGSGNHEWTLDASDPRAIPPSGGCEVVRCIDGTRAFYHYDPAAGAPADQWVFFIPGGASASNTPEHDLYVAENAATEYFLATNFAEMSSRGIRSTKTAAGILSPVTGNAFRAFNRVDVSKCTFDKGMGDAEFDTAAAPAGHRDCKPGAAGAQSCTLYFHGQRLWRALLADLAGEAHPLDLARLGGGDTLTLFTGNSNGATGMMFLLDSLAATVRSYNGAATVLGALDDRHNPALATEAAFSRAGSDTDTDGVVSFAEARASGITEYDAIRATSDADYFAQPVDDATYRPGGAIFEQYRLWWNDVPPEASCVAKNAASSEVCYMEEEVVMRYLSTPVFIHQTLRDAALRDKAVDYGDVSWSYEPWSTRMLFRLYNFITLRDTLGDDAREPHALGVFVRDSAQHVNIISDVDFFGNQDPARTDLCVERADGTRVSYHDALWAWVHGEEVLAIADPRMLGEPFAALPSTCAPAAATGPTGATGPTDAGEETVVEEPVAEMMPPVEPAPMAEDVPTTEDVPAAEDAPTAENAPLFRGTAAGCAAQDSGAGVWLLVGIWLWRRVSGRGGSSDRALS